LRSALDRTGKALSSGGDIQIIWEAVKMGYAAGVAPSLIVNHLISTKKSNLKYIKRLHFGTSSSYLPCLTNSFPDLKARTIAATPTTGSIIRQIIWKTVRYSIRWNFKLLIIDLAHDLGSASGHYQVMKKTTKFSILQSNYSSLDKHSITINCP
jgi:hypothetical protein